MGNKKKIGGVALEIVPEAGNPYVPTLMSYRDNGGIMKKLAYAVKNNMPVLLIGETGVGKTSAIRNLAANLNQPLRRVNVNGSMTAEDFVGQLLAKDGATYWKDGVLTEAMREGWWIVIDEINAASPEILFVLHSLMDDDHYIVLTEHPNREMVRPHPNFRLFATMNPPERYAGTKELNKALLSRFPMTLTVETPPPSIEYGSLSHAKSLGDTAASQIADFNSKLRAAYNKEEIEVFVSPRDTANIVKLYDLTKDLTEAVRITVMPRGTKAEQKVILDTARLCFGVVKEVIVAPRPVATTTAI